MIKRIAALAAVVMACMMMLAGCREASRANWKNGWKADSFDCQRRIVVYNARTDSVVMVAEGCFSLSNNADGELVVTAKTGEGEYRNVFVRLNENVIYVVEEIDGKDKYHYKLEFREEMPE